MAYSRPCPACGANLDPGERCNCKEADTEFSSQITTMPLPPMSVKSIDCFVSTAEYLKMKSNLIQSFRG
jgi:hypothetical protein